MKFSLILLTAIILTNPVSAAPKWKWVKPALPAAEDEKNTSDETSETPENIYKNSAASDNLSTEELSDTEIMSLLAQMQGNDLSEDDLAASLEALQNLDTSAFGAEEMNPLLQQLSGMDLDEAMSAEDNMPSTEETLPFSGQLFLQTDDFEKADINHDGLIDEDELLYFQQNGFDTMVEQTFNELDSNHDGAISRDELKAYYSKNARNNKTLNSLTQRFKEADIDHNDALDKTELQYLLQKDIVSNNKQIFQLIDADNSGSITKKEMTDFIKLVEGLLPHSSSKTR